MAEDKKTDPALRLELIRARLWAPVIRTITWFTTSLGRFVLLLPIAALFLYLLYAQVWRPIVAPVALPSGVTEQNPMLSEDSLQVLSNQQAERTQLSQRRFTIGTLFGATPPATPPTIAP